MDDSSGWSQRAAFRRNHGYHESTDWDWARGAILPKLPIPTIVIANLLMHIRRHSITEHLWILVSDFLFKSYFGHIEHPLSAKTQHGIKQKRSKLRPFSLQLGYVCLNFI